jgi:Protein of unknown function (DUF1553)/Protein of unknown function (DUF1549)
MLPNRSLLSLACVLLLGVAASAVEPDPLAKKLSAQIDRHLEADWAERGIKPAPQADDSEFLRRVYLDIIGRIPRASEVTAFLADSSVEKRTQIVDRLLSMPAYARQFAATTRQEWLPQASTDIRFFGNGIQLEEWLQKKFRKNEPIDALVRELLTVPMADGLARFRNPNDTTRPNPEVAPIVAFYEANELRPENLAAATTRLFLGVKLECAQCHDHPFATYSQEQFWQTAAFFGEFSALPPYAPSFVGPLPPQARNNQITIPNSSTTLRAAYFDGTAPNWRPDRNPREELASWLTAPENPYFAKNLANRMWARFFGIGLIDPIDEPGDANPPSHPELLDDLAKGLRESKFNTHTLIRAIVGSRAYQLTSRLTHPSQSEPRRFAKMAMKGLNGGQIFDSFVVATGLQNPELFRDYNPSDFRDRNLRGKFIKMFPTGVKTTETQTSILQSLLMMNSSVMESQTNVETGQTVAAIFEASFLTTDEKIDTLFLAALSRKANAEEREKYSSYLDRGGPTGDKKKAISDVFWILLNSTEFLFNH